MKAQDAPKLASLAPVEDASIRTNSSGVINRRLPLSTTILPTLRGRADASEWTKTDGYPATPYCLAIWRSEAPCSGLIRILTRYFV